MGGGRERKTNAEAQSALRREKQEHSPEWLCHKGGGTQEHRLKPALPVARRFCGGLVWDKMAGEDWGDERIDTGGE